MKAVRVQDATALNINPRAERPKVVSVAECTPPHIAAQCGLLGRGAQVQTEKKWLTITEAAQYIGMSVSFLRTNVRLRTVPHTRIGSKALRFDRDALDAWVTAQSCRGEVGCGSRR